MVFMPEVVLQELGRCGRAAALKHYSRAALVERVDQMLESAVQQRSRAHLPSHMRSNVRVMNEPRDE
jgi:hypothetical protein